MTENMRAIIRRWQKQLFTEEVKQRHDINERAIWSAATLCEVDDIYTRKIAVSTVEFPINLFSQFDIHYIFAISS